MTLFERRARAKPSDICFKIMGSLFWSFCCITICILIRRRSGCVNKKSPARSLEVIQDHEPFSAKWRLRWQYEMIKWRQAHGRELIICLGGYLWLKSKLTAHLWSQHDHDLTLLWQEFQNWPPQEHWYKRWSLITFHAETVITPTYCLVYGCGRHQALGGKTEVGIERFSILAGHVSSWWLPDSSTGHWTDSGIPDKCLSVPGIDSTALTFFYPRPTGVFL